MTDFLSILEIKRVHFIGIGGISMSALAKYCVSCGIKVSGSDSALNDEIATLKRMGVKIYLGHFPESVIGADAVVYTSAIGENNVELISAKRQFVRIYKRSEFLGLIQRDYLNSVCVSGSHGKTTTTAMLAEIFSLSGKNPTVFLGGEHKNFSNLLQGDKEFVISEACEYKKNFLDLKRTLAIVLNIDNDHNDSYQNMDDMTQTFQKFIDKNIAIINADDPNSKSLFNNAMVTFGVYSPATFNAKRVKYNGTGYSFDVYAYCRRLGRINLKVNGRHNVYNALASIATAFNYGIEFKNIKSALEQFDGVKRRCEKVGAIDGVEAYCDYAHHPSEIMATLSICADEDVNGLVVFQPHTYSRTKTLMDDFVNVLSPNKNLIIYRTYPARESFDFEGSAERLWQNIRYVNPSVLYSKSVEDLYENICRIKKKNKIDRILFLGAGDIYDIALNLTDASKKRNASVKGKVYKL